MPRKIRIAYDEGGADTDKAPYDENDGEYRDSGTYDDDEEDEEEDGDDDEDDSAIDSDAVKSADDGEAPVKTRMVTRKALGGTKSKRGWKQKKQRG